MEEDSAAYRAAQLESELEEARSCLEDKERDLMKAAEFGKRLLDSNQDLNNHMEQLSRECTEKIEVLEQDKYSLLLKLDCQGATLSSLQQELESLRPQLEQEAALKLQRLEEVHCKKLHQLSKHNDELKAEVDKIDVQWRAAVDRGKKQEESIEQLKADLASSSSSSSSPSVDELTGLQQLCSQERARSEGLGLALLETEEQLQLVAVEKAALEQSVVALEEQCREIETTANKWYHALEEANVQSAEQRAQLEAARLELLGGGGGDGGNSLFGEVEDRRLDVERRLISLQVQHEGLERTHTTTRQQLSKMKAEMSALLCQYGATSADVAHVQRLQRALQQSRSEATLLLSKLHKLERQQVAAVSVQERQKCVSAFVDFGSKKEYIQFLEQELEQARRDQSVVQREVDMVRTQLLWETNKLSEAESRLHISEQEQAKVKKELTKLRLRAQETSEKLQQATMHCKQLEADNKLLEEQVKSRGRKPGSQKRTQSGNSRSRAGTIELTQATEISLKTSTPSEESSKRLEKSGEVLKSCSPSPSSSVQDTSSKPTTCAAKDINILEELDREFDKQKCAELEKSAHAVKSAAASHNENVSSSVGAVPSRLPVKVVRVNKGGGVNECPQQ